FQAEDGIRYFHVTGVQTCALPISAVREDRVEDLIQYNYQFHEGIWLATRNRYLARQLRQLRQFIFRLQESGMMYPGRKEEAQAEHRALFDAIAAGDPDEAERIAREHFRRGEAIRMLLWRKERFM